MGANSQLHRSDIDDSMSGTTAVTVLVRGRTVHVANVGDSRAVLAERQGERFAAVDLSYDQTPYRCVHTCWLHPEVHEDSSLAIEDCTPFGRI